MVHEMDQSVGRLVQALSDRNMLKDTIIVFSSDNGGAPAPMNMNAGSNWPLRGVRLLTIIKYLFGFYISRLINFFPG